MIAHKNGLTPLRLQTPALRDRSRAAYEARCHGRSLHWAGVGLGRRSGAPGVRRLCIRGGLVVRGPRWAAGLLLYRRRGLEWEVLLAHPGGLLWAKKDLGSWTIPKGGATPGEQALACARREFAEETGLHIEGVFRALGEIRQKGGKIVRAWAVEGDVDPSALASNIFTMEWPPGSGNTASFPELDRFEWFAPEEARQRINPAQAELIDRLEAMLS